MSKTEKDILYWSNGQKKCEGNYKDGELDGVKTEWYFSEMWTPEKKTLPKMREETYKYGEKNGVLAWWYSNGQKGCEATYKNGELDGLSTHWNYNGQKMSEETYKDGELIDDE